MNIELWNKVKNRFEEHPECVDMGLFSDTNKISCMTVGCIAGWTVFEAGVKHESNIPEAAQELLGIAEEQAFKLFYVHEWPDEFQELYDESVKRDGHPARAVIAAMNAFERGEF